MKRSLLVLVGLLMMSSLVSAQVISNFNSSLSPFKLQSGNNGLDSLSDVPDPTNSSNHVMGMYFNFASGGYANGSQHGIMGASNISPNGAQYIAYYVYLPSGEGIPDSLAIDIYAQDKTNYAWLENRFYAVNIPRNVWYPLYFSFQQMYYTNTKFDYQAGLNLTGLQIFPTTAAWKGVIYVDNPELIGAKPSILEDFSTPGSATPGNGSVDHYYINTQYSSATTLDSIFQTTATDTNGVKMNALGVAAHVDSAIGGMWLGWSGLTATLAGNQILQMMIYIPVSDTFPSSVSLQLVYQPNTTYSWNQINNLQTSVPKGVWYPVFFPIADSAITNSSDSLAKTNDQITNFAVQVYSGDSTTNWKGTFYISDVALLGSAVPAPVWLAANFKSKGSGVINGLNGFKIPPFATTGSIKAFSDLIHGGVYTMEGTMSLSKTTPLFAAVRDSVPMEDSLGDKATGMSMNVLLPSGMPGNGVVKVYVSGGANDSAAAADTIGSQIMTGSFTKVMITGLDSLATKGMFDPTKPAQIGVEVYYPGAYDTTTWSGSIEVDSVFVYGISMPAALPDELNPTTGIETAASNLPREFKLYNNYPNPFNPSTQIEYSLPQAAKVVLQVYDVLGQRVATLVDSKQAAGTYHISFNMDSYASGVYLLRMQAGNYVHVQKMMLLK